MDGSYVRQTPDRLLYADPEGRFKVTSTTVDGFVLVHCAVTDWRPSTLRLLHACFDAIRATLPPVIGSAPSEPSPKFMRFMARFGFEYFGHVWPCDDGVARPVLFHFLESGSR